MTEPLPDTWHNRDLPVLREVVTRIDAQTRAKLPFKELTAALDFDDDTTSRALAALERDDLVTLKWDIRGDWARIQSIDDVSADAYRQVGAWPTPDTAADRLIAALEHLAATTDNDDERTRVRKILDGFAGSGRQIAVGVGTAIITGQVT